MASFVGTFQACWFVESMFTQVLFIYLVRTERMPFIQSMADWRVLLVKKLYVRHFGRLL